MFKVTNIIKQDDGPRELCLVELDDGSTIVGYRYPDATRVRLPDSPKTYKGFCNLLAGIWASHGMRTHSGEVVGLGPSDSDFELTIPE